MAILVLLSAKAKPENVDSFQALIKEIFPDTRSYDGCQELNLHLNMDDSRTFLVVGRWDSRPHYEKYLAWRVETGLLARFEALLEEAPSIQFYEVVDA
jgi:quinol monooxygenase YgiN